MIDEPGSWLERVHPEDRERVRDAWTRAAEGDRLDVEYRFASKDEHEVWLWHIGQLVPGSDGAHAKLRGLLVDVSGRHRIELERVEAVRETSEGRTREAASRWVEAEERFRALEQQIPAITYLDAVDGPQKTLAISEQTSTILGYTPTSGTPTPSSGARSSTPRTATGSTPRSARAASPAGSSTGWSRRTVGRSGSTIGRG